LTKKPDSSSWMVVQRILCVWVGVGVGVGVRGGVGASLGQRSVKGRLLLVLSAPYITLHHPVELI